MIELHDVQRFVLRRAPRRACSIDFRTFGDGSELGRFLEQAAAVATCATVNLAPTDLVVTVGLTAEGIGLVSRDQQALSALPPAFLAGMDARAGLIDGAAPGISPIAHAIVMVHGPELSDGDFTGEIGTVLEHYGTRIAHWSGHPILVDGGEYEPFGFRDGITTPVVEGGGETVSPGNGVLTSDGTWRALRPGELLIGHVDESGSVGGHPDARQIERNGSYLAIRRLRQDLDGFWETCSQVAEVLPPPADGHAQGPSEEPAAGVVGRWKQRVRWTDPLASAVAAQMIGRRRDGGVLQHDGPPVGEGFRYGDPRVAVSPAAHIRRANPRDGIGKASSMVPRHVLFRRSVPFWEETAAHGPQPAGLLFMACCADLQRQFEFVNARWLQDGNRFGLGTERDGLTGRRTGSNDDHLVSLDAHGRRTRVPMGEFVTPEGGVYVLVPSLQALRFLAAQAARGPA